MSGKRAARLGFADWADAVLAGTGWTASTVREAALSDRNDLATVALADGFATAARGAADHSESVPKDDQL